MNCFAVLLCSALVITMVAQLSGASSCDLMMPLEEKTGLETGLIFVPGEGLTADSYRFVFLIIFKVLSGKQ